MKLLAILLSAVACSSAQFFYAALPYTPTIQYSYTIAAPAYSATSTQFHAQDALGQFTFHHAGDNQVRTESKSADGAVRGAYSYVDPTGKLVNVQYVADANGYRVLGANNLPVAPAVSPEVKGPEPVQDTPEVVAARAAFLKTYEETAKAAAAASDEETLQVSRKKRETLLYPTLYALLSKSKLKVHELEPVDGAATPADTKKFNIKEKEQEVYTHQVPTLLLPSVVNQPTLVKSKVKVQEFVPVEGVETPADTKKSELKEQEKEVLAYSTLLPSSVSLVNQETVPSVVELPKLIYV